MEYQLAEIVQRVQAEEPEAFTALFEQTQQMVYYTALKMIRNQQDAEDAVQIVYMKIWNSISSLQDPQSAPKWIKSVAVNTCLNELDKRKRHLRGLDSGEQEALLELPEDETAFLPENYVDHEATRKIILDMIDSLPEKQRVTVYLYYFDELSIEEIAARLEVSPGTVKSRLHTARLAIRAAVEDEEKRGNKLYAMPVLLRIFDLDAKTYIMNEALAAAILQQAVSQLAATGQAGANTAAQAAPDASVTLEKTTPSQTAKDRGKQSGEAAPESPASQQHSPLMRGNRRLAVKIGIGIAVILVLAAVFLFTRLHSKPLAAPQTAAQSAQAPAGAQSMSPDQLPQDSPDSEEAPPAQTGPDFALPPTGGLQYTQAFDDGAGYVHVIIPDVPQELCTLHLYAASAITEQSAADVIAAYEANDGWGNAWFSNASMGNEDNAYVASLRYPDETGGSPFDLLVVTFNQNWRAVSYDILHVSV